MKRTNKPRQLVLYCKCGAKLAKYKKGRGRRLIKIHADRVSKDYFGIFKNNWPENTDIFCPVCSKRIATVRKINGKFVNKLNQGRVGLIKRA